jgi:hypothetical protein
MKLRAWILVGVAFATLTYGTVMVFLAFDRNSHSNSDTIRPFLITMAPLWVLAGLAARQVIRSRD